MPVNRPSSLAKANTSNDASKTGTTLTADHFTHLDQFGADLWKLADALRDEQNRHVREGLSEEELALFDLLKRDGLSGKDRERVKQASRDLLAAIQQRLGQLDRFWEKEQTKSTVETFILDKVYTDLPTPPFSAEDKERVAANVYQHVWQQALRGDSARAM